MFLGRPAMPPKAQFFVTALVFATISIVSTANAKDLLPHRWQQNGIAPKAAPKPVHTPSTQSQKLAPKKTDGNKKSSSGWTGWSNFYRSF
jgi:hypothetical protein